MDGGRNTLEFLKFPHQIVDEDYFDFDSILAENTNVSCLFESITPDELFLLLGQLPPQHISEKGHRSNTPSWIIPEIGHICAPSVPTLYNNVSRDVIHAGAKSTNFEFLQRNFYTFGIFITRFLSPVEGRIIAQSLLYAFSQRIGLILNRSLDCKAKPNELDETEKGLFSLLQESERKFSRWINFKSMNSKSSLKRKFSHET